MPQPILSCDPYNDYRGRDSENSRLMADYVYAQRRAKSHRSRLGYGIATHFAEVIRQNARRDEYRPLESKFRESAEAWRRETRILSSVQAKIYNTHYQRIIGMGPAALPFIFSELRARGGYWYWALECITGDNPAAESDRISHAKAAWLEYAVQRGYI
jgi:hypothetical protein